MRNTKENSRRAYYKHREERLLKAKEKYAEKVQDKRNKKVESLEGEIWRNVFEHNAVSNKGRVKMLQYIDKAGHCCCERLCTLYSKRDYLYVTINRKPVSVAKVVALGFPEVCGEVFPGCHVHHIDHCCTNNIPTNLVVLSEEEHIKLHQDSDCTYRKKSTSQNSVWGTREHTNKKLRKPIIKTKDGVVLARYESIKEAAVDNHCTSGMICSNLKDKTKLCLGYKYYYAE